MVVVLPVQSDRATVSVFSLGSPMRDSVCLIRFACILVLLPFVYQTRPRTVSCSMRTSSAATRVIGSPWYTS